MHARKDPHRNVPWIVADKHLVYLEYRTELSRKGLGGNVRQIQVHLVLAGDAMTFETNLKYLTCRDVAGHEVAVSRVFFFEEVPTLRLGNLARISRISVRFRDPNAPAFSACGFAHQPQFIFARDRGRMDLNKLSVRVSRTLLITGRHRAAGASHRVRRFTEYKSRSTRRNDHSVCGERFQFERLQIHRNQTAADLMIVEYERKHLPPFVFCDTLLDFPSPHLFIERVEKLLTRRRSGESRAMVQGPAETSEIEQAFFRTSERHSHPVEEVNDFRRHVAHSFDRPLVCEKVSAVHGVVKMLGRRVTLAL